MNAQAKSSYAGWISASLFLLLGPSAAAQNAADTPPPVPTAAPAPAVPDAAAKAPTAPNATAPASTKAAPPAGNGAAGIRLEHTASGGKLFRITEGLVVEGQRQKPNAFYVLQRASAPYDWEALEESFLPRILKAAEKPPF